MHMIYCYKAYNGKINPLFIKSSSRCYAGGDESGNRPERETSKTSDQSESF